MATNVKYTAALPIMAIIKTPLSRFDDLSEYAFEAHYCDVSNQQDSQELLVHYIDEGSDKAPIILMLHGEPTWSYLYRNMVNHAVEKGFRVIAPDLIGFGKSDKFDSKAPYTYANFIAWMTRFTHKLDLQNINLICQDWGGLIGLRMLAAEPERYANLVAANTFLPTGEEPTSEAFLNWQSYSQSVDVFPVSSVVQGGTKRQLTEAERYAYDAPFPTENYKWAVRQFPTLVPTSTEDPESQNNVDAWKTLSALSLPVLTIFGDSDPITKGAEKAIQRKMKGSEGQQHLILKDVAHFIQEDAAQSLIEHAVDFFLENQK